MSWTDSEYTETEECIEKLDQEERRLNTLLAQVQLLKHGANKIKGKKEIIQNDDGTEEIILTSPNDLSGESMKDTYRLEQLENIISKTNELLDNLNE